MDNKSSTVQFRLDQIEIEFIPRLDEFTSQEVADYFYTSDDYKKMKSNDRALRRLLKKGRWDTVATNDEYCIRGIELASDKAERQCRIQRVQAIVFSVHKSNSPVVYEQLAEMLGKATIYATEEALARAQEDAEEAKA